MRCSLWHYNNYILIISYSVWSATIFKSCWCKRFERRFCKDSPYVCDATKFHYRSGQDLKTPVTNTGGKKKGPVSVVLFPVCTGAWMIHMVTLFDCLLILFTLLLILLSHLVSCLLMKGCLSSSSQNDQLVDGYPYFVSCNVLRCVTFYSCIKLQVNLSWN